MDSGKEFGCYSVSVKALEGLLPDHFATAGDHSESEKTPQEFLMEPGFLSGSVCAGRSLPPPAAKADLESVTEVPL